MEVQIPKILHWNIRPLQFNYLSYKLRRQKMSQFEILKKVEKCYCFLFILFLFRVRRLGLVARCFRQKISKPLSSVRYQSSLFFFFFFESDSIFFQKKLVRQVIKLEWPRLKKFIVPCNGPDKAKVRTVPTFNSCTKCKGNPGITHNRTPDCNPVSRAWVHGWVQNWT